ncbi:MAG: SOS response-associated peptidase family protein [Patescibacteria group bacterium]
MKLTLLPPIMSALRPRFSIRNELLHKHQDTLPGSWLPVLRDAMSGKAEMFRWGLAESKMNGDDRLVFATKIENLLTRNGRSMLERRLIVPVESFELSSEGRSFRLRSTNLKPMALAALWDIDGHWRGRPVRAFRLITGPTLDGFEALGPRMPIVLCPSNERAWLWHFTEEDAALDALEPYTALQFD